MAKIRARWVIFRWNEIFLVMPKWRRNKFFCLPWWKMDKWEDTISCLKREIVEELWVEPKVWNLVYINEYQKKWKSNIDFWYNIENVEDFNNIDLSKTSHWKSEILTCWFYNLKDIDCPLMPENLPCIHFELNENNGNFIQKSTIL